jgi:hypothetical protein
LTEERFMLLLLYCLPLLFKVWVRSGSWSCCYVVYHYSLRFDRGVVHVVLVDYSFYHYCLMFDRVVVHVVVAILSTITVKGLTEEWFMLWLLYYISLLFKVWQRSYSYYCCYFVYHYCLRFDRGVVHVLVGYIVYHYCLRFDRGVVHVVLVGYIV